MRDMPPSWKLHLTAFWLAFICVCLVALVVGWNATSVVTDEPTSYLLYETAFLGLLFVALIVAIPIRIHIGNLKKEYTVNKRRYCLAGYASPKCRISRVCYWRHRR